MTVKDAIEGHIDVGVAVTDPFGRGARQHRRTCVGQGHIWGALQGRADHECTAEC